MLRRITDRGLAELRKMLANYFKDAAVSFLSCRTSGMLFSRALFSLMAASMMSSWGAFLGILILYGKDRTEFTILSDLVLGA